MDIRWKAAMFALVFLSCASAFGGDVYVLTTRAGWSQNKAELRKILDGYVRPGKRAIGITWNLLDESGNEIGQTYYKNARQLVKDGKRITATAITNLESKMLAGTEIGVVKNASAYKTLLADKKYVEKTPK